MRVWDLHTSLCLLIQATQSKILHIHTIISENSVSVLTVVTFMWLMLLLLFFFRLPVVIPFILILLYMYIHYVDDDLVLYYIHVYTK